MHQWISTWLYPCCFYLCCDCSFCRIPTAGAWTAGAGIAFLFVTDWKVVTQKIPFIKDKYDHETPKWMVCDLLVIRQNFLRTWIAQFWYIKIPSETINITARLLGIIPFKLYNLFPGALKLCFCFRLNFNTSKFGYYLEFYVTRESDMAMNPLKFFL